MVERESALREREWLSLTIDVLMRAGSASCVLSLIAHGDWRHWPKVDEEGGGLITHSLASASPGWLNMYARAAKTYNIDHTK